MSRSHGFVNIQGRGTIALPAALRRSLHLDQPGAQVEVVEREDGSIELVPHLPVAAREVWGSIEPKAHLDVEPKAHSGVEPKVENSAASEPEAGESAKKKGKKSK